MKVIKRHKVSKSKYGKIIFGNRDLEPHEEATVFCLSSFGLDIETLIPSNIPKSKNPDLLMLGTVWEMKGPKSYNEKTIRKRFRKAKKQAGGRAVFDLRNVISNVDSVEKYIIKLFTEEHEMYRIMIIEDDSSLIDIFK